MTLPDLNQLLQSKVALSVISATVGVVIGNLIAALRSRLRTLEYTVHHERVGFSTDDQIFGSIQVTWQSNNVTNLFTSRLELANHTGKDFTNLNLFVYAGVETFLLSERSQIIGTPFILPWAEEFRQELYVPPGQAPTAAQFNTYNHTRKYLVPVLNRSQRAVITYLTTVPSGVENPAVWLDMLHEGVRVAFRQHVIRIHGVPKRVANAVGIAICGSILALCSLFLSEPWAAGLICLLAGLLVQRAGALIYRGFLIVKAVIVPN